MWGEQAVRFQQVIVHDARPADCTALQQVSSHSVFVKRFKENSNKTDNQGPTDQRQQIKKAENL